MFLELLKAVLFGIVQGITEWLPISSTGHMILLNELIHLQVSHAFYELFQVVIQLGSILAVVVLYWQTLNPFSLKKSRDERIRTWQMWFKVAVGVIPLAVVGFFLDDFAEEHLNNYIVVAITLVVYGILFIIVEDRNRNKKPLVSELSQLTYGRALCVGLIQVLAFVPGTSRSGATILGAILLGLSRPLAAEFSFFLAIPAMVGASGLTAVKMILDDASPVISGAEWTILVVGTVVAFFVSMVVVRLLVQFVRKHDFKGFGIYRIVLGLMVLTYFSLVH